MQAGANAVPEARQAMLSNMGSSADSSFLVLIGSRAIMGTC
jgi:hypothetical protein